MITFEFPLNELLNRCVNLESPDWKNKRKYKKTENRR
jgi:hypothetical protein